MEADPASGLGPLNQPCVFVFVAPLTLPCGRQQALHVSRISSVIRVGTGTGM